mmetsp:Transcript_34114/g.41796  ORF Transcript_34114/g.41796 Transcript_34114/m.41796 type:complete len:92 (-) Transcript_34114:171-446(-)
MVKMMVIGAFFASEVPEDINIVGSVKLSLTGSPKRRFLEETSDIAAPEDKNNMGTFDLNVHLDTGKSASKAEIKHTAFGVWLFTSIIFSLL